MSFSRLRAACPKEISMSTGFDFLVTQLESRYDHQSARSITREALNKAGLKEAAAYKPNEIQAWVDQLSVLGDRLDSVYAKLGMGPSGARAPVAPEPPKKEEAKAEAPKQEEAKAEAPKQEEAKAEPPKKEEAKAEAAPAEAAAAEADPAGGGEAAPEGGRKKKK
jgi:hypothetical protein